MKHTIAMLTLANLLSFTIAHTSTPKLGPIFEAASSNNVKLLQEELRKGVNINSFDSVHGLSPLHHAVIQDHINIVTHLLNNGANPNLLSKEGLAPLHWAAMADNVTAARTLIKAGATKGIEGNKKYKGKIPANFTQNSNILKQFKNKKDTPQD